MTAPVSPEPPRRPLPLVMPWDRFFWESGAEGVLRFLRCQDCRTYVHPPRPVCPKCWGDHVEPEDVSGRATVAGFTVNHHQWLPGFEPPYVIAIVQIDEDPDVRLTTNIVGCPPDAVSSGQRVRVVFEHAEAVWIPLFEPEAV
jgi:uncharacterized OB-fold protein